MEKYQVWLMYLCRLLILNLWMISKLYRISFSPMLLIELKTQVSLKEAWSNFWMQDRTHRRMHDRRKPARRMQDRRMHDRRMHDMRMHDRRMQAGCCWTGRVPKWGSRKANDEIKVSTVPRSVSDPDRSGFFFAGPDFDNPDPSVNKLMGSKWCFWLGFGEAWTKRLKREG